MSPSTLIPLSDFVAYKLLGYNQDRRAILVISVDFSVLWLSFLIYLTKLLNEFRVHK
jgi:hypothetical protein